MKLERQSKEVVLRLSYEEARELKEYILHAGWWTEDLVQEIYHELSELFGENNE